MAEINRDILIPYMDSYKRYLGGQERGQNARPLSNVQEDYKREVAEKAAMILNQESWAETEIGNGSIGEQSIRAVQGHLNLIGRSQISVFVNKVREDYSASERVLFDLYHERKDQECFEQVCQLFGRRYDLVSYLYFIFDPSRYLPLRSSIFDGIFKKLGIDLKTSGRCSWDNYQEFLATIGAVRTAMQHYYQTEDVDLLDAHSFLWTINLDVLEVAEEPVDKNINEAAIDLNQKDKGKGIIDPAFVGLSEYLKNQEGDIVYLPFSEIETIIGQKLPEDAYDEKWWKNRATSNIAQSWLSVGFKQINIRSINSRHGVEFQRYPESRRWYSYYINKFLFHFFLPLLIACIATFAGIYFQHRYSIKKEYEAILLKYDSSQYDGLKDSIYTIVPKLNESKDTKKIIRLYELLYYLNYQEYTKTDEKLSVEELDEIKQICEKGIELSEINNNSKAYIVFYSKLGEIYKYQYEKTLKKEYCNKALTYFDKSIEKYKTATSPYWNKDYDTSHEFTSQEQFDAAIDCIKSYLNIWDINYLSIISGEYSDEELYGKNRTIINELMMNALDTMIMYYEILYSVDDFELDENVKLDIASKSVLNTYFSYCLFAIKQQKNYGSDIIENFLDRRVEKTYLHFIQIAKYLERYDVLSEIYYELCRIYFFNYLYLNDQDSKDSFIFYLSEWMELSEKNKLDIEFLEKNLFITFHGDLLDEYINIVEKNFEQLSFQDNPSLYGYTAWDLAKHYNVKKEDLINKEEDEEEIKDIIMIRDYYIKKALMYFTEYNSPSIYKQIMSLKK